MDSEPGCCWRCGEPARGACPQCQMALYCSTTCLRDDRAAHLSECDEAGTAELPCANCGRLSRHLTRCARCHLAAYCSTECGNLHSRLHLPACLAGRDAVLRLANSLTHAAEPFRLPVYFGDGVHALNLLRGTDQTGEEPCQLLQLSAQLPHLLRTAASVSDSRRPLLATLASDSGHELARAYLLLFLLARGAGPAATVQVMYSLRLTPEHARLLQAALEQLVTATYSQLLQLVPWVRLGRAALSHWQEAWRAWLHAMQDAGCLARMERCRDAAMAEPETAKRLERYLSALPERQQCSAHDFLLEHGTLMGDRQRRATADCANVTLLALNPRNQRHREAFSDLRLGSDPPTWLEAAAGADTVLAPPPVPAGALADWDRAEVARALGADVDPAEGCRRLAEDCTEAAEARAAAGRLSVRLVQFTSLSELDEQLAELRFERVFTADAADRLGLFDVLEMAEILLAPVPHALIVSSHSRWATLSPPTGTALSALRGGGSMTWDRQMDTEKFRLQTYLQGERLAYAARARHKDVLDHNLRVPTVPEVTSFGTLVMTSYSRQLQAAVPHKFRSERRAVSNGDATVRFLEWRRDPEGARSRLAEQQGPVKAAAAAMAAAGAGVGVGNTPRPPDHRGPGLYERHLQNPAPERDTTPVYGSIRRQTGSERRPNRSAEPRPDSRPDHRSSLRADHRQDDGRRPLANPEDVLNRRPDRTQSVRRPRRVDSAPLVRTGSLPAAQRRRQESRGYLPAREPPMYENPAAVREAERKAERDAAAREAERQAGRETREARSLAAQQAAPERPRSEPGRVQRRGSRRRTIEVGPVSRPAPSPQTETFRRTESLRVGKNQSAMERLRAAMVSDDEVILRDKRPFANRQPATLPRSLEGMFPSLRSPLSPPGSLYANSPATEEIYAVPRKTVRVAEREQIYAMPRDTLRTVPRHQQSSVGRSGTPQFALSPDGSPYAMYGGQERPRSPGADSLSSQHDSPLSASHYSALQTPEGRRRLTNMFTFPSTRSERPSSACSVLSASRETSDTPPSLPAKRFSAASLRKSEPPPLSDAPLGLSRKPHEPQRPRQQSRQPERGYSDAHLTLPRQASETLRARQADRAVTLPRQPSEALRLQAKQRPHTYSGAPVPLPRQSAGTLRRSERDSYAVPQPRPRQLGGTSLGQQTASGSEDTLESSSTEDKDTIYGSAAVTTTTEPQEPEASPADIDLLTHWREPKSIDYWLRQDCTRQSEFDQPTQTAVGNSRWTRDELAPLPQPSSPPTRPGRITPTTSSSASASATSLAEKRRTFLRSHETTEGRLERSLENAEPAWLTNRPSSTNTVKSEERSSRSVTPPSREVLRSGDTSSSRRDFRQSGGTVPSNGDLRRRGYALLSTEDLPHSGDEPQTIAELGLRDTAAAWVLELCIQEVLSEEREALRAQLIGWLQQKITEEMLFASEALEEVKAASRAVSTEGNQTVPDPTSAPTKPVTELAVLRDLNDEVPSSERASTTPKKAVAQALKGSDSAANKDDVKVDNLPVPKSPEAAPPKLNQNVFSLLDVNSEESGKLGSPRFPVIDTPVRKSMPPDKFLADMFQLKSPTTGEQLVTIRLDATSEAPPSPGEKNPAKTPLFSSSFIIPSPERTLLGPQKIVINMVAEPLVVQSPAIPVPLQPEVETEVKARIPLSTPPIATVASLSGNQAADKREEGIPVPTTAAVPDTAAHTTVATSATDKLATPNHSPIGEKADIVTSASPPAGLSRPPTRRVAVRPLSLLTPGSTGRAVAAPSGYIHRSPVEEPYPVLGDDLSSRRARLVARAAARASSSPSAIDQSNQSDSSLEQPQSPSRLSDPGTSDPAGETPQTAVSSEQDDGNDGSLSAAERFERDEPESDSGEEEGASECANTSWTYRSSLHIPMDQKQEDSGDPQLQEILIRFPLVALDSGEPQAGQPDVTVTNPKPKVETAPTEQSAAQAPCGQDDVAAEPAEESLVRPLRDEGDTALEEAIATPAEPQPVEEADVSEDDHSTPPPLPLSPPPKSAVQVQVVAVEDGATATESRIVAAETGAGASEGDEAATECGIMTAETEAAAAEISEVGEDAGTEAVETSAAAKRDTKATDFSAVEAEGGAAATKTGEDAKDGGAVAEKDDEKAAEGGAGVAKGDAEPVEGGTAALRRHSVDDKQRQRLGNLVRRRRSRKMSMDKEYHDMKQKLSEIITGSLPRHHTESGNTQSLNRTEEVHDTAGPTNRNNERAPAMSEQPNGSSEGGAPTSEPIGRSNGARHPGSLANSRRKSRPLSMDAEYYAMKGELQVHNGHPGGHTSGHGAATNAQRQEAEARDRDDIAGHSQPPAPSGQRTDHVPAPTPVPTTASTSQTPAPAPATTSQTQIATPSSASQSPAKAALRRGSGRLSMDKEFFAMRAQLTRHSVGHHGAVSARPPAASSVPGYEPEDPPSPLPSPASGLPPAVPQPRRGGRRLSIEEEFFAIRAAHRALNPVQSESEEQSPPSSPKVQPRSSTEQGQVIVPKEDPELRASAGRLVTSAPSAATLSRQDKKPPAPAPPRKPAPLPPSTSQTPTPANTHKSPAPAPPGSRKTPPPPSHTNKSPAPAPPGSSTQKPSAVPPTTTPKPSPASQTINLTPAHPITAAGDRRSIRPLPLDPDLLASRAVQSERPPADLVPQFPPTSPATPPPSPTSVFSRTGRPGSIRKRVQELEHPASEGESIRSPQQELAPAPFNRTGRAGSVREKIRRMEQLQQGQTAAALAGAAEGSPVTLRTHSTHSPFTRLGSGGDASSLTVRLQPSPPAVAQRGSLSPSGPPPPTMAQRGPLSPSGTPPPAPVQLGSKQRRSLPTPGPCSGAPGTPQTSTRKPSDESKKIPEQHSENIHDAQEEVSSMADSSAPENIAESSSTEIQPSQVTPPIPAARRVPKKTPSPPDLLTWPWTAEDEAAEAKQSERAEQDGPESSGVNPLLEPDRSGSSEQRKTSPQSRDPSPSAYETADESFFSPRASVGEPRKAEEAAAPEKTAGPAEATGAAARARSVSQGPAASSGTEIDAHDDDVFVDASGVPAAQTAL